MHINKTTINYFDMKLNMGEVMKPFMPRLQYMSFHGLLHLLRTSRSLIRELYGEDKRMKTIDGMIDHFRSQQEWNEAKARERMITTICNMILRSEGLGTLQGENTFDPDAKAIGRITGFSPKRSGGF